MYIVLLYESKLLFTINYSPSFIKTIRSSSQICFGTGQLAGSKLYGFHRLIFAASKPHALREKVGVAVADGGDRIGGQELAIRSIVDFYQINEMVS